MSLSKKIRFAVFKRDGFTCRYCGRHAPEVELHVDHVTPRAKGGRDSLWNLVTACVDCNLGKRIDEVGGTLIEQGITARIGLDDVYSTVHTCQGVFEAHVAGGDFKRSIGAEWFFECVTYAENFLRFYTMRAVLNGSWVPPLADKYSDVMGKLRALAEERLASWQNREAADFVQAFIWLRRYLRDIARQYDTKYGTASAEGL